ncbi:MAG: DL-endopeptidase inhibitor IseA family protein [Syntrophomonas sp.]
MREKRLIVLILTIFIIFMVSGCNGGEKNNSTTTHKSKEINTSNNVKPAVSNKPVSIPNESPPQPTLSDQEILTLLQKADQQFWDVVDATNEARKIIEGTNGMSYAELPAPFNTPEKLSMYYGQYWQDKDAQDFLKDATYVDGVYCFPYGDPGYGINWNNTSVVNKKQTGDTIIVTIRYLSEADQEYVSENYEIKLIDNKWKVSYIN